MFRQLYIIVKQSTAADKRIIINSVDIKFFPREREREREREMNK